MSRARPLPRSGVLIAGLGHIGSSLAVALQAKGVTAWGWDRDPRVARFCRARGWVDGLSWRRLPGSRLILVISTPETAVWDPELKSLLAELPEGTLVTEVFSSKAAASRELERLCKLHGLRCAWSHPLAGREGNGPQSADPTIFEKALVLIDKSAPLAERRALTRFWRRLECRVEAVGPKAHQARMAQGSHLMHALAYSLMHAIGNAPVASPSVMGATRVAKSDPAAWATILSSNRAELRKSVARLREELLRTERLLEDNDTSKLEKHLAKARALRLRLEDRKMK